MTPSSTSDNAGYCFTSNAECTGDGFGASSGIAPYAPYLDNLCIREFGVSVRFASYLTSIASTLSRSLYKSYWTGPRAMPLSGSCSGLRNAVRHVFLVRTKKKMIGVHTSWIIAGMADFISRRNWPLRALIGIPVNVDLLPVNAYPTVASTVGFAIPEPAGFCFDNFGVKTRVRIALLRFVKAGAGTKVPFRATLMNKGFLALQTLRVFRFSALPHIQALSVSSGNGLL